MIRTLDVFFKVLRNGAELTRLLPNESSAPILRMKSDGGIPTALSGAFAVNWEVNWLTDELEPTLVIDGTEHKLGRYLPATVQETRTTASRYVQVEAYDRAWRVRDTYTQTMLYFEAGTNYLDAVKRLLYECGISQIRETDTEETLPTARQGWLAGTSYLDIVNQLLSEINYKNLWFDSSGSAVLEPSLTPSAVTIQHTLNADDVRSLLLPQLFRTSDIYDAPNSFTCVSSTPDLNTPLVATAENTNPQSPLSIMRRGRRISTVVSVPNIASQAALQLYANRLLFESMTRGETLTVSTGLLPGYGVNEITALHYEDLTALCRETGWTMELKPGGTMTHTLERMVYNLEL